MRAMILAAGEGRRFLPYTQQVAKPALPFCGYPLLYYSLFQMHKLDASQITVNVFHLPDTIQKVLDKRPACFSTPVVVSDERSVGHLLGSGGGIAQARLSLEGEGFFLVMNGDEVILPHDPNMMAQFITEWKTHNVGPNQEPMAMLLTMEHPEAGKKFGAVWVDEDDLVYGFGKVSPPSKKKLRPLHYLGTQILSDRIFELIVPGVESNILYDVLTLAMSKGEKVFAHSIRCYWYETGNVNDFLLATHSVLKLIAQRFSYLEKFFALLKNEFELLQMKQYLCWKHRSVPRPLNCPDTGFSVLGPHVVINEKTPLLDTVCDQHVTITLM